jgi:ribonucleoside-diphosphate reductase alpha chain
MAVAPNANIGLLVGTTPGIDPRFAQVFSRNKISGKYLDLNHNLVKDLKNMGLWEDIKELIIENQGDIGNIPGIPAYLKEIYRTAFTTNPHAYIEVAARAQKWVDQALSRNMYLESRDMEEMKGIYMTAWKKGLKTTYYLHMKPRHTAEQSTTTVNKAALTGKRGFGAIKAAAAAPVIAESVPETDEAPSPVVIETTPFTPSQMPTSNPLGFSTVSPTPSPVSVTPSSVVAKETQTVPVRPTVAPAVAEKTIDIRAQQVAIPTSVATPAKPVASIKRALPDAPMDPADNPNVCISCQ